MSDPLETSCSTLPFYEFLGLPGAGKSTVVRQIATLLGGAPDEEMARMTSITDWKAAPLAELLPRRTAEWRVLARSLMLALPLKPVARLSRFRVAIPLASAHRRAARAIAAAGCATGRVIADEWVLQRIWSIIAFSNSWSSQNLQKLTNDLCGQRRTFVIHLNCPVEVAATRIEQRGTRHSRFDRMPFAERARLLTSAAHGMESIARYAQETGCNVVRIDAKPDPREVAHQIVDRIPALRETAEQMAPADRS